MAISSLTNIDDLDDLISESHEHPVMLFKHSTRCPVSTDADAAYREFALTIDDDSVRLSHLDLIRHRDISNAIATTLAVTHQSPQAILLRDGAAVWHASHSAITMAALRAAVASTAT